jgi:hypothetical protein
MPWLFAEDPMQRKSSSNASAKVALTGLRGVYPVHI